MSDTPHDVSKNNLFIKKRLQGVSPTDNMELRSSRSRSRTPFLNKNFEEEEIHSKSGRITRVTRSTYKSHESYSGEITQSSQQGMRLRKGGKLIRYRTSDYSSEDGDNEVSSTHIENTKNTIMEQSTQSNGNGLSALKIYRDARQYWNRYPKTDYTYSRHSKDRVEIAPGVYNMPNMSRRSIHEMCDTDVCNKETNTESILESRTEQVKLRPRALFQENNNIHSSYTSQYSVQHSRSILTRVFTYITNIFSAMFMYFYGSTEKREGWMYGFSRVLHKMSSRIMLLDTWLLRGQESFNKTRALLALCFIPLFLLGGLWSVTALSHYIVSGNSTYTPVLPMHEFSKSADVVENVIRIELDNPSNSGLNRAQLENIAQSLKTNLNLDLTIEKIIALMLQDADVQVEERVSQDDIEKIVAAAMNFRSNDNSQINELRDEVEKLKTHFTTVTGELRRENLASSFRLTQEMRRCCRKSFVEIERHVSLILNTLLEKPMYKDQILTWLNTVFVAKQDLEERLTATTSNLDALIESNSKKLMDDITAKIKLEISSRLRSDLIANDLPDDDYIRKIVMGVLATYDADKTGLVDYALESGGGEILSTRCTEQYQKTTAVLSILGVPIWYPSNTPRVVITQGIVPAECWAFQNFPGYLVIRLSANITIEAFSYEHVSRKLVPNGRVDSAPKNFSVHGFTEPNDKDPVLLGDYMYDSEGEPLQFFPVQNTGLVFDMVELRVVSNHGHLDYTCLYRFRVHGNLYKEPT